jgi:tetratricopeptide (TPR) repeat protein
MVSVRRAGILLDVLNKLQRLCRNVLAGLLILAFDVASYSQDLGSVVSALQSRDFDSAIRLSRELLQANPGDFKIWTLQGVAYAGSGRAADALRSFKRAQTLSPNYLPALEGEAELEFKARDPAAKLTLQRLLSVKADDPVAHAMLAALAYLDKDCAAVVKHYGQSQQAIQSRPDALQQFGSCLLVVNEPKQAVSVFHQLLVIEPANGIARYNLAASQLAAQFPRDTIATLESLSDPRVPPIRVVELRASAYETLGDTPRAVEILRSAIVENPKEEDLYISFATICLDHRSFDIAVKFLTTGLRELPASFRLYVTRGILNVQLGDYEHAAHDFETGERIDPAHSFGSLAQGLSQMQQSKLEQALTITEAEIKKNPNDAFLQYLKAETLRRQGIEPGSALFNQALLAAQRAVTLNPDLLIARDLLGVLYLKNQRVELARQAFQEVVKRDPTNQSALYHLITLAQKSGEHSAVPDLLKRLAVAKQEAQKEDVRTSQYRILESEGK